MRIRPTYGAVARPRETATWPVAFLSSGLGVVLTVATYALASRAAAQLGSRLTGPACQLIGAGGVVAAVAVARQLPRRARAAFVIGVVTPVVIFAALFALLLWTLAHDPHAFEF